MEKEKIVSYKEALFLQENGYSGFTKHYYDGNVLKERNDDEILNFDKILAPSYTQANKWLKKNGFKKFWVPYKKLSFKDYPIIKDNRIVSDKTFAVRFCSFLENIPKDWWMSQPYLYEEYNYMKNIAKRLLEYQIETMTENEIQYFDNIKDIIEKYIDKL